MASAKLAGYDETVICPYNKCHVIMKSRIQTHLVKCARSHPEVKLEQCPFDSTHRLRPEDIKAHIEECPSRASFDRYVYDVTASDAPSQRPPPQRQFCMKPENDDAEECWDHYNTPTYDPQKYAKNANVLRNPQLLTPAQRRQFADEERKRLSKLDRRDQ